MYVLYDVFYAGADPGGGGGPGGQDPPLFCWTPKLHKEGKKWRAHARENSAF